MGIHDGNEHFDNLTSILQNNRGSEAEGKRSDSGLKNLIQELDKDEEKGEKVNKDLPEIVNKFWQDSNAFEKFKNKMKNYKNSQNCTNLVV